MKGAMKGKLAMSKGAIADALATACESGSTVPSLVTVLHLKA